MYTAEDWVSLYIHLHNKHLLNNRQCPGYWKNTNNSHGHINLTLKRIQIPVGDIRQRHRKLQYRIENDQCHQKSIVKMSQQFKKKKDLNEVMTFKLQNGINRQRKWPNPTQREAED